MSTVYTQPLSYLEIIARVQHIKLRMRRRVRGALAGDHRMTQRAASGMDFDALRHYHSGDDVRRIDWNSTVRTGTLMVRTYREYTHRTVLLLVDLTETTHLGSTEELKDRAIQTIALMIGAVADAAGDSVGLILMRDGKAIGIPPRKGRSHAIRCAEEIIAGDGAGALPAWTDLQAVIERIVPRRSLVFCITDGIMASYEATLRLLAQRASVACIRVRDRYEYAHPMPAGLLLHDATHSAHMPLSYDTVSDFAAAWYDRQTSCMKQLGIPVLDVTAGSEYDRNLTIFLEHEVY